MEGVIRHLLILRHSSDVVIRSYTTVLPFVFLGSVALFAPLAAPKTRSQVKDALGFDPFAWLSLNNIIPLVLAFVAVTLTTRYVSGIIFRKSPDNGSSKGLARPEKVPIWLPYLGNTLEFALIGQSFMRESRDIIPDDVFSFSLGFCTHHVPASPSLIRHCQSLETASKWADVTSDVVRRNVFGLELPSRVLPIESLDDTLQDVTKTARVAFKEDFPRLISFNKSVVDQMEWERHSGVQVINDSLVQVDSLVLIREFLGTVLSASLFGASFLEDYPALFHDLWTVHDNFYILATGLPRWYPYPGLVAAHTARKRLLGRLTSLHERIEKDLAELKEHDDSSDIIEARHRRSEAYKEQGLSPEQRAAADFELLYSLTASTTVLSFWLILHILSFPSNLFRSQLFDSIAPYCSATQRPQEFRLPEPPELKLDLEGLATQCPLLLASYSETVRMYGAGWRVMRMSDDAVVQGKDLHSEEKDKKGEEKWELYKGEYIDIFEDLHHHDARYFPEPTQWKPMRHQSRITKTENNTFEMVWESISYTNGFGSTGQSEQLSSTVQKLTLSFVTSMLVLWDLKPLMAVQGSWALPPRRKLGTPIVAPKHDVIAKISAKDLRDRSVREDVDRRVKDALRDSTVDVWTL